MALFRRFRCGGLKAAVTPHRPSDVVLLPIDSAPTAVTERFENMAPDQAVAPSDLQCDVVMHSPISRLPPEVLACVFELYVDDGDDLAPDTVSPQGPCYLAQVCKLWRAIVESDPRLWTSIHFYFPEMQKDREKDLKIVQPVFDMHLERSGTLPMSLTFADHRTYSTATKELVCLLVNRLRTHSNRWKRISLHLSCGYFPLLFTFTPSDLSLLEHLHLSSDMRERFIVPRLNFKWATNLKSLAYSGSLRSLGGVIDVHWEQLVEVSLDFALTSNWTGCPSPQRFAHLHECRNLTTCSLGIDRPASLNGDEPVTFPQLRTLRVRRLSSQSDASFLDDLILPQLDTLDIDAAFLVDWCGTSPPWHDRNFSNLLARSGCALRHLSIQDVDFPSDEVVRCLALSPTLTSLRFVPYPRSHDIADLIRALAVSQAPGVVDQPRMEGHDMVVENNGPLVPELRQLTLATSHEGCLDSMMAMLRSRGGACVHADKVPMLGHVKVVFFHMPHRPGDQMWRVARFQRELARWVSESGPQDRKGGRRRLEAEVLIDSPYLVEYINIE